jgi:hypothetical protein
MGDRIKLIKLIFFGHSIAAVIYFGGAVAVNANGAGEWYALCAASYFIGGYFCRPDWMRRRIP